MTFKDFSIFLISIEELNSRNEITVKLSDFLNKVSKEEVKISMYLMQGRLVPKFVDTEFNFSDKLVIRALDEQYGKDAKNLYSKLGDSGLVAESILTEENRTLKKLLQITEVYGFLEKLAFVSGRGSQEEKLRIYKELLTNLDPLSARYLTRIIIGNLRIGFSDKTVLDAFSWFLTGDKSLRKDIDSAFGARGDLGELAEIIIENKNNKEIVEVLKNIKIKPGIPVAAKLVEREKNSKNVWERMPNCFVQPKLDGLRGQLHYEKINSRKKKEIVKTDPTFALQTQDGSLAEIYSRNMESLTDQFPELINSLKRLNVDSIILDSEIIGFDEENNKYFTYQETMTRRRKYNISEFSNTFPVKAMCFDVLFYNGEDLTHKPIEERIEILNKVLGNQESSLEILEIKKTHSEKDIEDYFRYNTDKGLEGIIAKDENSTYEPGSRNFTWIKLKGNTRSELVDTIDVAVLGYYSGGGVRAKYGFGAVLAGVYDPKEEKYYSIGKVGSGFTEDTMPQIFKDMNTNKVDEKPENYIVEKNLRPDVWIKPGIIMEIVADEITRSPSHTTARGFETKVPRDDTKKGLSIRFPRIKQWNREDKDLPNTVEEIVRMYELRKA